jgi:OmcA/MtrC family decaheme c-type cytochrome
VNFATGVNHPGGFQADDTQCASCHVPKGETPFDASVIGAHMVPEDAVAGSAYPLLGGVQITLTKVVNGAAGKAPTIDFNLLDGSGKALPYSSMSSLTFVMAGPTTDYGNTNFGVSTTPGYVTESGSATTVTCSAAGACTYTFTHAIPANATGTFAISFYGSRTAEVLNAGTTSSQSVTESPFNNVIYFSVDGSPVVNRRTVVQVSNCNACHVSLELHGGSRRNTDLCVMCHNPANTDFTTRPTATVVAQQKLPNLGIDFNLLVHRIHSGSLLPALGASYTVIGYQGSVNDFTTVLYPAMGPTGTPTDTANCSMCHVNNSEQTLPVGLNPTVNNQAYINPAPAVTAACTGCHADLATSSHALSNTTSLGEACNVCHSSATTNGVTMPFAVSTVHAQY